jgi:hypothetical protein
MEIVDRNSGMLASVFSHHTEQPATLWNGSKVKNFNNNALTVHVGFLVIQKSRIQESKENGNVDVKIVAHLSAIS